MARARSSTRQGIERERIDAVGTLLTQVGSALFITGPGLSIDSGLPNYRGIPGLLRRTVRASSAQNRQAEQNGTERHRANIASEPEAVHVTSVLGFKD